MGRHRHAWSHVRRSTVRNSGWTIIRCRHCHVVDAVPTNGAKNQNQSECDKCGSRFLIKDETLLVCTCCGNEMLAYPSMTKRQFFQAQKISKPYSTEEKAPVIQYAMQHGIGAAHRQFKVPRSTIGAWVKGKSPIRKNSDVYKPSFIAKALRTLKASNNNARRTAINLGIPRQTLTRWRDLA